MPGWEAPDGDRISGEEGLWTLYLPAKNGLNLVAQHVAAEPGILRAEKLETLTRELLSFQSNAQVDALGGETELTLFGDNPVEYSGGVVTVNLGSSALGLSYREFYTLSLALAATLCEIESVRCVNVLVAGQSVGLDTTGSLAMGSLIAHPGENLPVLWEQMEAKRTPVGQNAAETPLTSYMTLYYPLENGEGISCENRTLTFPGQTPQQMTNTVLENLSHGAMYLTGVPEMPDLTAQMSYAPLTSELADGGRMLTLSFREGDGPGMGTGRGGHRLHGGGDLLQPDHLHPRGDRGRDPHRRQPADQPEQREIRQVHGAGGLFRRELFEPS